MHGAVGTAYLEYEDDTVEKIGIYEASVGTTTLVPAISAAPTKKLLDTIKHLKKYYKKEIEKCAAFEGIHLEGPFFSVIFKGAHQPHNIRNPELSEMKGLIEVSEGMVKIMTIAPELSGAEKNTDSLLYKKYKENNNLLDGKAVFEAFDKGCEVSKEVLDWYFDWLAVGIRSIIKIFAPDAVILAGGISAQKEKILVPLKRRINMPDVELEISELQNDAGAIGAAIL